MACPPVGWSVRWSVRPLRWSVTLSSKSMKNGLLRTGRGRKRDKEEGGTKRKEGRGGKRDEEEGGTRRKERRGEWKNEKVVKK